ncbi:zinc finger, CCHC-type containing protein [Tanacetum coccineum]
MCQVHVKKQKVSPPLAHPRTSLMHRAAVAEMIFYLEPNKKAEAVKLIEESSNNTASSLIEITQVERLVRYIVEEAPEDAKKGRTFKFPFIVCEIFIVRSILFLKPWLRMKRYGTLMNLLFSFIEPEHPNSALPVISVKPSAIPGRAPDEIDAENGMAAWSADKKLNTYEDEERVQQARLQTLKSDFEMLHMKEDETIDTFTTKLTTIVNKAASLGHTMEDEILVRKLLNAVPDRYLQIVASIEQYSDLSEMTLEEAIGRLKTYEERIKHKSKQVDNQGRDLLFTRYQEQGRMRGHGGFNQSQGQENNFKKETHNNSNKLTHDKSKVMCFKCKEYGHFAIRMSFKESKNNPISTEETWATITHGQLLKNHKSGMACESLDGGITVERMNQPGIKEDYTLKNSNFSRPSAIPGRAPNEVFIPVIDPIGLYLHFVDDQLSD